MFLLKQIQNRKDPLKFETNLEETTFQPDSSLKNQLQSNAVKSNLTKAKNQENETFLLRNKASNIFLYHK